MHRQFLHTKGTGFPPDADISVDFVRCTQLEPAKLSNLEQTMANYTLTSMEGSWSGS
jgi:hypothetical protein